MPLQNHYAERMSTTLVGWNDKITVKNRRCISTRWQQWFCQLPASEFMSDLRELLPWLRQLSASEFVRLKKLLIPHLLRVSKLWSNSNITSKKVHNTKILDLVSYNQSVDSANEQLENMAIFRTELVNLTPLIITLQKCMFELKKTNKQKNKKTWPV